METVLTVSFSGQNKMARIAITSNMITIVGQCAFVNDQKDDACAVCGAVAAGVLCATGAAVTAGVVAVVGVFTATDLLGEGFVATGELGCVVATGAEAETGTLPALVMVFAIATSVLCMPVNVLCTTCCCADVNVEFTASELFNWVSIAASVLNVPRSALTSFVESPVVATGVATAVGWLADPESPVGTIPACISRLTNVAFAT